MVFAFFKAKRSAHLKKKDDKPTAQISSTSMDHPSPFPNPLALNPPNRLHWIPKPKGQEETARIVSGDLSATADLSNVIHRADRLAKVVPELNTGGLVATQRLLKTGGADDRAVDDLIADQARAQERLRAQKGKRNAVQVLPTTYHQVSIVPKLLDTGNTTTRTSSFDFSSILESFQTESGCKVCKASIGNCSACYSAAKTILSCNLCRAGTSSAQHNTPSFPRSRNPSPERLARPVPLGYETPGSPASDCPSSVETLADDNDSLWLHADTLASLSGSATEDEDEDTVQICEVTNLGFAHHGAARVVDIGAATSECCSPSIAPHVRPLTIVRPAGPSDRPRFYSLPPAGLPRPDSPTLPPAFPAPLFSRRK